MQDDPIQLAIGDQDVRAAAQKPIGNVFSRKQPHHVRNRFEAPKQELVCPLPPDFEGEVCSVRATPGRTSTPSSFNRTDAPSLIRMLVCRNLCFKQYGELVKDSPDASRPDGKDRVSRARFSQNVFDPGLHRAGMDHVLVTGGADRLCEALAGNALDRRFIRRINFGDGENIRQIEGPAEIVPEMFGAREAVRLKQHEQSMVAAQPRAASRVA